MSTKSGYLLDEVDASIKYAYVLINKNPRRGGVFDENGQPVKEQEFKTGLNILFESSIIWPGGIDPFTTDENGKNGKTRPQGKYFIRYYDGCSTLFKDNQPTDKNTIDALVQGTVARNFNHGYFFVDGFDKMMKIFMDWTSLNESSPYRNPNIFPSFKSVLAEKNLLSEGELLELEDKASNLAKTAPKAKMISHANFLEIALADNITNVPYSDEAIRIAYRMFAKSNPKKFIATFNDETLEFKYKVRTLIIEGKLSMSLIPNSLTWVSNGMPTMDISGLDGIEQVVNKAASFAQTDDGKAFLEKVNSF